MVRVLVVLLIILLVALPGSVLAFEWHYAERIYPGASVWDVDVGGMRPDEAATVLVSDLGIDSPGIKLYGPDKSWSVRPTDLGMQLDPWATLVQVYYTGRDRSASIGDRLLTHAQLLVYGEEFSPVVMYDDQVARLYLEVLADQVDLPAVDAALSLDGLTPVARTAQEGRYLDVEATLAALSPAVLRMAPAEVDLVIRPITPTITDAEMARTEAETLLDGPLTLVLDRPLEGDPGPWVISAEELATVMVVQVEGSELHASLNEAPIRDYLEALTYTLAIEPVDARYHFDDTLGQLEPISSSVEGRALDVDASLAQIVEGLTAGNRYIPLAMQSIPPRYPDTATAEELGIIELVAEGDSYFIGSPSGRDRNIRLATPKFDGIVIDPGATFSFNHYLGEVTAEAGYDESYITSGEELAIEVGGGICQVSTTAFRAAFWGGYPIVERWYHNHRVGYYELMGAGLGMDATVYSPVVDFKFTNDKPYPLLIETQIEEGSHRLVFRFYSTGDGRQVERESPEISDRVAPGPPIYQLDEKLANGAVIQWQSAVNGLTVTVGRRVLDAEGALLYDDVFVSKYSARRASYHYGPGYKPPEEEGQP